MNRRNDNVDQMLDRALDEIRNETPDTSHADAAIDRVWKRLSSDMESEEVPVSSGGQIRNCKDFQSLIPDYLGGKLAPARHLLVQDHLGECLTCRRVMKHTKNAAKRPATRAVPHGSSWVSTLGWRVAAAAVIFLALVGVSLETEVFSFESGGVIRIESLQGAAFRVTDTGTIPLAVGDVVTLARGEGIRTAKDSVAMLALYDNSRVEMRERSELTVKEMKHLMPGRKADGVIDLRRGSVIVEASDQGSGHLFVDTDECRVAVTGTVFSVSHGMKGSRVSVIEGEVHVNYRGNEDVLQPGQQTTTNRSLHRIPVSQDIAWSQNSARYIQLLHEMRELGQEIDEALRPGQRYSTTVLDLAPADTVVYVAMPNLSDELQDAYEIIQDRIATSEVLSDWWSEQVVAQGTDSHLEEILDMVRDFGDHLGEEVVMTLQAGPDGQPIGPLFIAELDSRRAFVDMLTDMIAELEARTDHGQLGIYLLEGSLPITPPGTDQHLFIWAMDDLVALTPNFELLQKIDNSIRAEDGTRLAGGAFHQRLTELYDEGVEWAVGVDLEKIIGSQLDGREELEALGLADVQHVIAEREQIDGRTENRAVLTFNGPRRMLASWLAEPAPMGALDYVSPDANFAVAFVMKDLGVLVDELFDFIGEYDVNFEEGLAEFEREAGIDIRKDLASPLGGEFAVALDGPILPVPSWKLILEVYEPETLVSSLEWLIEKVNDEVASNLGGQGLVLERESVGRRDYFRLASLDTGLAAHFVFDDGYLVAGPSRALIDRALQNQEMGIKLTDSRAFLDMLPRDSRVNFSGLFFQDVSSLIGPLASTLESLQMSGEDLQILDTLATETKPMIALIYGEEDRIIFSSSSDGGLFSSGLSALTGVGSLLGMQQSLAQVITDIEVSTLGAHVDVRHDVTAE